MSATQSHRHSPPPSATLSRRRLQTGERIYQNRLPGLKMIAASPLIIGDKLLLLDEDGGACVVRVGREFELLGKGNIDDVCWSTPAVVDGSIYLRGVEKLYCIRAARTTDIR